jgi:hypothetical protein
MFDLYLRLEAENADGAIAMQPNKKFVGCAVFAMIGAGAAASADLRWQWDIRKTQETRS